MDANALGAQFGGDVTHGTFQRRFGDAHDVVVLHHHLAAVIGHREQRAALAHQRLGEVRHADEGPARDVECGEKAITRYVDNTSLQGFFRRERDGMHHEIEMSPRLGDALENRLHLAGLAHIERQHDRRFEFARQRLDVFFGLFVEISYREFGAEGAERLGTAPGDRLIVGDPDNEALLAFEKLGFDGRDHMSDLLLSRAMPHTLLIQLFDRCASAAPENSTEFVDTYSIDTASNLYSNII